MTRGCRQKLKGIDKFHVTNLELEEPLSVQRYDLDVVVTDLLTFRFLRVLFLKMFAYKMTVVIF